MGDSSHRFATVAGVCSPVAALVSIGVATALFSGYDWPTAPFSVMGTGGGPAALVFNGGLVVAGVLALPFAWRLWTARRPLFGILYALLGVSFAVAGAFPMGSPLHAVATGIFLIGWLLPSAAGVADWRNGRRSVGIAQCVLGTAVLAVWLPYDLGLERAQVGYGGAELVSLLVIAGWSAWTARELWRGGRSGTADDTPSIA